MAASKDKKVELNFVPNPKKPETSGTFVFAETNGKGEVITDGSHVVGKLYVRKNQATKLGGAPKGLKVTIEATE